jgi:hypothetical protein
MTVIFTAAHVAALSPGQAGQPAGTVPERESIRDLLLELDDGLPPAPFPATAVLGLDLHRHWSAEHRTALWFPHTFNGFRVEEIYLRYGKSRAEIRGLAALLPPPIGEPADLGGFPSHAHLAVGLAADAFFYQLVIGPRAWLDHGHLLDQLTDRRVGGLLFGRLQALAPRGYCLHWGDEHPLTHFTSGTGLRGFIESSTLARAGEHWLVIRKHVPPTSGMLSVSSSDLRSEIEALFPVFDLAARRR